MTYFLWYNNEVVLIYIYIIHDVKFIVAVNRNHSECLTPKLEMSRELNHAKTSLSKSIEQFMVTLRAGSCNFPMATINLFASSKLFPRSPQRDNGRPWEWEIGTIRAGDPDEKRRRSEVRKSGCYSFWSDYERLYSAWSLRETRRSVLLR